MFRLIDRIPDGIEPMLMDLEKHITNTGLADMVAAASIITQVRIIYFNLLVFSAIASIKICKLLQDCEKYVEQLLMLFTKSSKLVKEAFSNDPRFLTARDKAFKTVVNDISVFKLELPTTKQVGRDRIDDDEFCPRNYSTRVFHALTEFKY